MKQKFLLTICFTCFAFAINAQTLGTYSAASILVGHNITVTPGSAPVNTVRITVSAPTNFQGVVAASPVNGKVFIVDAKPAGSFPIKLKAFNTAGVSTIKTFILTVDDPICSQGGFIDSNEVQTGLQQVNVVIGDFNGDGKQDLAAAHEGGNNTVSIRLGNGSGNFTGTTEVPVGSHPYNLAVGDFNGDGKEDLVVCNSGDNCFTPLLGNGSGGFTARPVVDVKWTPIGVAIGDFNNDGSQDVVTANLNDTSVSIRLGDGVGGFYGNSRFMVGLQPYCVVVGDFNNDAKHDIATANSNDNTVSIRLGNGLGSFSGTTEVPVGIHPYCVALGDFNNDGKQDLATANYLAHTVSIRLGDGHGNFSGNTEVPAGTNPYYVAIGNFNGDGHEDIAIANYFSNNVSIRFGNGAGGFIGNIQIGAGSYPISLAAGEFNNDSLMDLAVSNYNDHSLSILIGDKGIPSMDSAFNSSPVCEGQSISFHSPGGILYAWTGPNGFTSTIQEPMIPVSTLSDSGWYDVTLTDSSGCEASASTKVTINELPVVSFILSTDTICTSNPPLLLSGGSPLNGTYLGTGVTNDEFDPSVTGPGVFLITYKYADHNDCVNSDSDKIYVLICEGLEDPFTKNRFTVYPNPVKEEFKIDLAAAGKCSVTLFTPEGKLVKEWIISGNQSPLFSISEESAGIYFLKISTDDEVVLRRIVKL